MRFLHTADWHLGREWHGIDRTPDLRDHVIPEIVDIALDNHVGLVVVAGDILEGFGRRSLQLCSMLLRRPIKKLLQAGVHVALIPGNHDNSALFRLLQAALDISPLSETGQLVIFTEPGDHRFGPIQVLGMPYLTLRNFASWLTEQRTSVPVEGDLQNQTLSLLVENTILALKHQCLTVGCPAVLLGHFAVSGTSLTTDDVGDARPYAGFETSYARDLVVSRDALLNSDQTPQYNALGHMHRAQQVPETVVPTYYAGAPERFDRGEADYEPRVLVVDLPESGAPQVASVSIDSATPFIREMISSREELLALADRVGQDLSHRALGDLTIKVADLVDYPPLRDEAYDLFPRLREANTVRPDSPETRATVRFEASSDYARIADHTVVFRDYFKQFAEEDRPHLSKALDTILEELADED
jgi:DNA repair exonuclease SbcCD nuclease subunit